MFAVLPGTSGKLKFLSRHGWDTKIAFCSSGARQAVRRLGDPLRSGRHMEAKQMSTFGKDLIRSLGEAIDHAKGNGGAIVHVPVTPREVREQVNLTHAEMASLMGMSLSG